MDQPVVSPARRSVGADRQGAGKDMAAVVIGVLSDQVDASRGEIEACPVRTAKKFCKFVKQLFFMLFFLLKILNREKQVSDFSS